MKYDDLDLKILGMLSKNGRISSAEISRAAGASERTVANRVTNLIESGVISVKGIVNRNFFGYEVVADIFCTVESVDLEQIAREISTYPEVSYVAIAFGELDISVQMFAKSTKEVQEFVIKKLSKIPGIVRTTTVIVPTVITDIYDWRPLEIIEMAEKHPENT